MANEYRFAQVTAEVLHDGECRARIAQSHFTVLHSDQQSLPNTRIAMVNAQVLHSDQSSLKFAFFAGAYVEVLTSTRQLVSPNSDDLTETVDDSEVFAPVLVLSSLDGPPRIQPELREVNPFPATLGAVDAEEQQRTIREQHNSTQAGDTTFDYGLLVRYTPDQLYTLGSLGRFYHDDYGLIQARYVQFKSWVETLYQGCPVGRFADSPEVDWVVTNDYGKSGADLAMGFAFLSEIPSEGAYGWMVVDGANLAAIQRGTDILPAPDTPYCWHATGVIQIGVEGKIIARRWGRAATPDIGPGSVYVKAEGLSPASIIELLAESLAQTASTVANLTTRVSAAEASIAGLTSTTNQLSEATSNLQARLTQESEARARDIQSVRLLAAGTDWSQAINDAVQANSELWQEADEAIRTRVNETRFIADQALARANADDTTTAAELSAITNQLGGINERLDNFRVSYPTPVTGDVLVSNVTPGDEGGSIVVFESRAYKFSTLFDVDWTTPPTDGQVMAWDAASNKFKPVTPSGGGGGIADAPSDGNRYARRNGAWESFTPGIAGIGVRDEGSTIVSAATHVNFVGAGVTVTDVSGVATVTIPGGGGGGGGQVWETDLRWKNNVVGLATGSFTNDVNASLGAAPLNSFYWGSSSGAQTLRLDFGSGITRICTGFRIFQNNNVTQGTWRFQGSNDASSWIDLDTGWLWQAPLTGGFNFMERTFTNTTGYRYYRFDKTAGSTSNSPFVNWFHLRLNSA